MKQPPENIRLLEENLSDCTLCPRDCHVDRTAGQLGSCRIPAVARVVSAGPHFGEEPPLVGTGGSGTIFFAGCNLHCVYCQNCDISQTGRGTPTSPEQLADICLQLQDDRCHNVNFVTPSHVPHAVAHAVWLARERGLSIPTVYNSGGYDKLRTLTLLEGLIDIYMPDFKYGRADEGRKYSLAPEYPAVAAIALAEMYRQVGPLRLDHHGRATQGLLVRHLVLPADLAHSRRVIQYVADAAPGATINIMPQYRPAYHANQFPELLDRADPTHVADLKNHAHALGLQTID